MRPTAFLSSSFFLLVLSPLLSGVQYLCQNQLYLYPHPACTYPGITPSAPSSGGAGPLYACNGRYHAFPPPDCLYGSKNRPSGAPAALPVGTPVSASAPAPNSPSPSALKPSGGGPSGGGPSGGGPSGGGPSGGVPSGGGPSGGGPSGDGPSGGAPSGGGPSGGGPSDGGPTGGRPSGGRPFGGGPSGGGPSGGGPSGGGPSGGGPSGGGPSGGGPSGGGISGGGPSGGGPSGGGPSGGGPSGGGPSGGGPSGGGPSGGGPSGGVPSGGGPSGGGPSGGVPFGGVPTGGGPSGGGPPGGGPSGGGISGGGPSGGKPSGGGPSGGGPSGGGPSGGGPSGGVPSGGVPAGGGPSGGGPSGGTPPVAYETVTVPAKGIITIRSPNFPSAYNANAMVVWSVTSAAGQYLKFTSTVFDLAHGDILGFDGQYFTGAAGPAAYVVNASRTTVWFRSDASQQNQGFSVDVQSFPSQVPATNDSAVTIKVSCAGGMLNVSNTDPEISTATSLWFTSDNSWKCRLILRDLHAWLLEANPTTRNANSPVTASCNKGNVTFSHLDPGSTESSSFGFSTDNTLTCRSILYNLHRWLLARFHG